MRTTPAPARRVTLPRRRCGPLALLAAGALLAACDGTQTVDGILAPPALSAGSGTRGGTTGGSGVTVVRGQGELYGSWTRVGANGGVLTEQTFTFGADGSGVRTTVLRTALGDALAVEQAPFRWNAGAGILQLRFLRDGAADTVVRAAYVVLADLAATVLRLDGVEYVRTGG